MKTYLNFLATFLATTTISTFAGNSTDPASSGEALNRGDVSLCMYNLNEKLRGHVNREFPGGLDNTIWHASVMVMGKEYQYGKYGVLNRALGNISGNSRPNITIPMGTTSMESNTKLDKIVEGLEKYVFKGQMYNFDNQNSMHFANQLLSLLVNKRVPREYFQRPENLLLREKQELMEKIARFHTPPSDNLEEEKSEH